MQKGTTYKIKEGQDSFTFKFNFLSPNDYGMNPLPSWDTTIYVEEKTKSGFTLKFGTPCPKGDGKLYLTLYTPNNVEVVEKTRTLPRGFPEPTKSKRTRDLMSRI